MIHGVASQQLPSGPYQAVLYDDGIPLLKPISCGRDGEAPLMGAGQMPAAGEDERDEARLFYDAATRVTQRLVITTSGNARFSEKLKNDRNEQALWQP